jgi:hypothetical protein
MYYQISLHVCKIRPGIQCACVVVAPVVPMLLAAMLPCSASSSRVLHLKVVTILNTHIVQRLVRLMWVNRLVGGA